MAGIDAGARRATDAKTPGRRQRGEQQRIAIAAVDDIGAAGPAIRAWIAYDHVGSAVAVDIASRGNRSGMVVAGGREEAPIILRAAIMS